MTWEVIKGDARELPLADESVDLIVTSPPYFALRSYRDDGEHYQGQIGSEDTPAEFVAALMECFTECRRVLKPSGSLWVNLGDKYSGVNPGSYRRHTQPFMDGKTDTGYHAAAAASEQETDHRPDWGGVRSKSLMGLPWRVAIAMIDSGWILRAEVVWSKPNGLPESVTDRVRRSHEQWFHFTKEPQYFSAVDELREPQQTLGERHEGRSGWVDAPDGIERGFTARALNPLGRLPGSVWVIPTEPLQVPDHLGIDHFAAFPQEWPRRIIMGWAPTKGVCTECGEGRRPVVDVAGVSSTDKWKQRGTSNEERERLGIGQHLDVAGGHSVGVRSVDITGYACACDEPIASTKPAVVLDPFGGTGTTAGVAHMLGCHGISVDLSEDYCRLTEWRIGESGHFQKTLKRDMADRQGSLL